MRVVTDGKSAALPMALFDGAGNRKYLNEPERLAFVRAAHGPQRQVQIL